MKTSLALLAGAAIDRVVEKSFSVMPVGAIQVATSGGGPELKLRSGGGNIEIADDAPMGG